MASSIVARASAISRSCDRHRAVFNSTIRAILCVLIKQSIERSRLIAGQSDRKAIFPDALSSWVRFPVGVSPNVTSCLLELRCSTILRKKVRSTRSPPEARIRFNGLKRHSPAKDKPRGLDAPWKIFADEQKYVCGKNFVSPVRAFVLSSGGKRNLPSSSTERGEARRRQQCRRQQEQQ